MIFLKSPEYVTQELGERVRVLRLAQNFSQGELAQRCGVSLSSMRRLEASGQATVHLLVRVAQALNAPQGWDALFALPTQTIADLEQRAQVQQRKRARSRAAKSAGARA